MDNEMKLIRCNKCCYEWKTKSKMMKVSCPNCGNKVRVEELVKEFSKFKLKIFKDGKEC